ncbi:hypothetical protein KS4_17110 [Poriferisphaera corsica]|uniref:Uncharacterized protein n=1 Tax=Poriferisphaera corsica TaxID=2528020 RepID=A0A517YTU7_9BACT|nr:hypothetical protein KS4_17110 [Poriferisphaera corsica]
MQNMCMHTEERGCERHICAHNWIKSGDLKRFLGAK